MSAWLYEFVTSGLAFLLWLQEFRTPFLDTFFAAMTALGDKEFYLLIMPLIYWCLHKPFGREMAYLLVFTSYINTFLKTFFKLPRPPIEIHIIEQGVYGYGLPSGHAMYPMSLWGYTAWRWRHKASWLIPALGLFIGLIAFSRLYLGVHYPADTVTGLLLGLLVILVWLKLFPAVTQWVNKTSERTLLLIGIGLPLLLFFLHPSDYLGYPAEDSATIMGIAIGMNIGFLYEAKYVNFTVTGSLVQRILRYFVGIIAVILVWGGLRVLFGLVEGNHVLDMALRLSRYAVTGLVISWFVPALFIKLKLAEGA